VLASLQQHFISVMQRLFTWVEGYFRFDTGVVAPEDKITVRVDLENLIIEGSRQLREWEQLQSEIPSFDMALRFTDRPGSNIRNVNLSVEEWRVVSYINPKNTIRQICKATRMNDLEMRRVITACSRPPWSRLSAPRGSLPRPPRHSRPRIKKNKNPWWAG